MDPQASVNPQAAPAPLLASPATLARLGPNRETLKKLLAITVLMFGFGFALVPLYKKICEVTGINNLIKADVAPVNSQVDLARNVVIEFDASHSANLPWSFKPVANSLTVHPGQLTQIDYVVVNSLDVAVTGQAIPSYAPAHAAPYFKKLECFCFRQQTLAAHETKRFPVVFVIDPDLPRDVGTITLSYTFFTVAGRGHAS